MCLWFSAHFRSDVMMDRFKHSLAHAAGYCLVVTNGLCALPHRVLRDSVRGLSVPKKRGGTNVPPQ